MFFFTTGKDMYLQKYKFLRSNSGYLTVRTRVSYLTVGWREQQEFSEPGRKQSKAQATLHYTMPCTLALLLHLWDIKRPLC
jgi:hypothetical protein